MDVILFPTSAPVADGFSPEHRAFCLVRRAMNQAFAAWLRTQPLPSEVETQIGPAQDVLRQP